MTRREVSIHIGGVEASKEPTLIRTVLGSCISACLWDPVARIGGMNHFLLPSPGAGSDYDPARFGIHAMDLLIGAMQRLGGARGRLQAKLFGGGHVLRELRLLRSVPEKNIAFIRRFVVEEGIPVVAEDLGGDHPRQLQFCTDSGQAFVKTLGDRALIHLPLRRTPKPQYGEITLFD